MKNDCEETSKFDELGFLSDSATGLIPEIKFVNKDLFDLSNQANKYLQSLATISSNRKHVTSLDPQTIWTTTLIRSASLYQGFLILIERGMITESEVLARCLWEDAFFIAALDKSPSEVIKFLKESNLESKTGMSKTLIQNDLIDKSHPHYVKINEIATQKNSRADSIKKIASLGPLSASYLNYSKLSNVSMHFSASSLSKYLTTSSEDRSWTGFKVGPGDDLDIRELLKDGIRCAIAIAIGGSTHLSETTINQHLTLIMENLDNS